MALWRKSISSRGNSQCQGVRTGMHLEWLVNSKEASGLQDGRVGRDEVKGRQMVQSSASHCKDFGFTCVKWGATTGFCEEM